MGPGFLVEHWATERLKTLSVWSAFRDEDLRFRPAPRARSPLEHMVHQCTSEDAWVRGTLGLDVGLPALPAEETRLGFLAHYAAVSGARERALAAADAAWFEAPVRFFDVPRSRAWVLVRRLTHTAHHRGQLTVLLRLLRRPLHSTYGPTADTGGLLAHRAPVVYRYPDEASLLEGERAGGRAASLPPPAAGRPLTERPDPA